MTILGRLLQSLLVSRMTQEYVGDVVNCGQQGSRSISMPNCTELNPNDCNRGYDLYIPNSVCRTLINETNVLPVLFTIPCFGCNPNDMKFLGNQYGEIYNFITVVPHGLGNSFNSNQCCGYAMENNINDVAFFKEILRELSEEYQQFINLDIVYGMGWSNGGYMVTSTAELYRAIAPISGYEVDLPKVDKPMPIFIHHAEDDDHVQFTGCCNDPTMPACCCGISELSNTCQSAMGYFQDFGHNINKCKKEQMELSFEDEERGIMCYEGVHCRANTTICTYMAGGHFNEPNFQQAFPMANDIFEFFAKDACSIVGGRWASFEEMATEQLTKRCVCTDVNNTAAYCLAEHWEDHTYNRWKIIDQWLWLLSLFFLGVCSLFLGCFFARKEMEEEEKYKDFMEVPTIELTDHDDDMPNNNFRRPLSSRI